MTEGGGARDRSPGPVPGGLSPEARRRAAGIRVVATDIDGVWTDARMYFGPSGEEMKAFSTYDGMAVALLREAGIPTVIVTSEETEIVRARARKLAIERVYTGVRDKRAVLQAVAAELEIPLARIAYIGDDVNDLGAFRVCGFSAMPSSSPLLGRVTVDFVTGRAGGEGAFRELADLLLAVRSHPDPLG